MSHFSRSLNRELQHIRNDRGDFFLMVAVMPLLAAFIWWIFSAGQPDSLPAAIVDYDQSSSSRQLARAIDATPGVALQRWAGDQGSAIDALRQRKVYAVLVIPASFERNIYSATPADVLLLVNSQYATYASTLQRNITTATMAAGVGISAERWQMAGVFIDASYTTAMPINVLTTPLFNEGPNYEIFLAATLIPALMQILAMILAVSAVGRELRDGTANEWLSCANHSLVRALITKLLPAALMLSFYAALILWFFQQLAPESYTGSLFVIWLTLVLMNFSAMAIGVLIVAITRNFRMGLSLAGFYSAPAFAFSGQAFPLFAMPIAAQYWASILPLTHWLKIYNQLWLAGAPLTEVISSVFVLMGMLVSAGVLGFILLNRYAFLPASWGAR